MAYHKVDSRFEFGVTRVTPGQFKRHIELLVKMGLKPCSLGSYLHEPSQDKVAITFDDAYESVYTYAYPVLKEWGGGFTVFPVANYVGGWNEWEVNLGGLKFRHLSWTQMREMDGIEVGSHTLTHRCLLKLPQNELMRELADSKKSIEDSWGKEVRYLSLPFGRYNERVLGAAREAGYEAVCSLNPDGGYDGFVVGRCGVYLMDSVWSLKNKLGYGRFQGFERWKLRFFNRLSGGTIMVKKWREGRLKRNDE